MNREIQPTHLSMLTRLSLWEDEHPYLFSFVISLALVSYVFFSTSSIDYSEEDLAPAENIQFIDLETIRAPKRITRSEISTEQGDISDEAAQVERAMGTSDDANAVDIAFYPNIAPPKPVGALKKLYPQVAREKGIEAIVNVELLIGANGRVKYVTILGMRLSKELPPETYSEVSKAFVRVTREILLGAQFTPAVVEGEKRPIKMEIPLKYRLEGLETGL
ncbi:MAG TPA: energy transducer TonB [Spirochaetota bacterium]|nr:energy transducer TonB [Spirochaetota bacterium]HPI91008.1 energy transducer TonB [Spirochaetota bacterium]HPR48611.1 energy transducer TonB [Spirochaetota bacterium]